MRDNLKENQDRHVAMHLVLLVVLFKAAVGIYYNVSLISYSGHLTKECLEEKLSTLTAFVTILFTSVGFSVQRIECSA